MKPHEEWLFKARNDIDSAKIIMNSNKKLYDIVVYHTQQCAEKSLKAYQAFLDVKIEKTHSLMSLTRECETYDSRFKEIRESVSILNPYATLYRYPMGSLLPTHEETEKAIDKADGILQFVCNIIDS